MLRFPRLEKAQAWYGGDKYRVARGKPAGASDYFNMIVVEGMDTPHLIRATGGAIRGGDRRAILRRPGRDL